MTTLDRAELLARRLAAHGLGASRFADPVAAVSALGAVQAQDLFGATWAIAQRTETASADAVAAALDSAALLRTHVLRPTWHIVAATDLRWMQSLTGVRVERSVGSMSRSYGLDATELARTDDLLRDALAGGERTRPELTEVLATAGVDTADPVRVQHILIHAEVTALIASGPVRAGKQTYALVDARVEPSPEASTRSAAEAAGELARRYLTAHGPAGVRDLAWWSGMTVTAARAAITSIADDLEPFRYGDTELWGLPGAPAEAGDDVLLLSNYDEYVVGYGDRSALFDGEVASGRENPVFQNVIVARGVLIGTWSPRADDRAPALFGPIDAATGRALDAAIERHRSYLTGTGLTPRG